jgi:nicotinamidase-related amidase
MPSARWARRSYVSTFAGAAPGRTEQPARFTDVVAELGHGPDDIVATKLIWGAFVGTDLETQLKGRSVTQEVIAGVATERASRRRRGKPMSRD